MVVRGELVVKLPKDRVDEFGRCASGWAFRRWERPSHEGVGLRRFRFIAALARPHRGGSNVRRIALAQDCTACRRVDFRSGTARCPQNAPATMGDQPHPRPSSSANASGGFVAKPYYAVVVGGGHNGLTCAPYLAKAGKKVLALERRHGSAAPPSPRISSRGSSSRCIPMLSRSCVPRSSASWSSRGTAGDPAARRDDHAARRRLSLARQRPRHHIRELRRWSRNDAEAYEEYGQLTAEMARFIKPILSIVPPDPARSARWTGCRSPDWRRASRTCRRERRPRSSN